MFIEAVRINTVTSFLFFTAFSLNHSSVPTLSTATNLLIYQAQFLSNESSMSIGEPIIK